MDPQSTNSPDLHMPPPSVDQDGLIVEPEQENAMSSQVKPSDSSDAVLVDSHGAQHAASPLNVSTTGDSGVAATSDDDNSLDEEWVQKAKAIVDQTKSDPYQQSRELSKVKASYLKTHYNKDIKIADDQSL